MHKQFVNDEQLVSQYIKGDESALAKIVELHKQTVFDSIFAIVKKKEIAEDLFQETFFKVIVTLKKGKYNEQGKFLPWVLRIANNIVMDYFRTRNNKTISTIKNNKGQDIEIFDVLHFPDQSQETGIAKTYVRKKVRRLIRCLDFEQREMVILRHYFGMSYKEIADRKEICLNTALGRMHYAIRNLNRILVEQNVDFEMEMTFPEHIFMGNEK